MKTKVYILRHSETDYNLEHRHDHEGKAMITQQGEIRAQKIADLLSDHSISAIYSSPLPRCVNTITPLADKIGQSVITDDRLRETFFGPIQDKLWNEFSRDFLDELHDINAKQYDGYEHMSDVKKRVGEFIDSVLDSHRGENIVICSHASPIFQLVSYIDRSTTTCPINEIPKNTGITHEDAYILKEI